MKKKKIVRMCAALLALFFLASAPAARAANLEESIKQKQDAISQAQNERKQLESGLSDVKAMVKKLQSAKNDMEAYVVQLDQEVEELERKIDDLKAQVTEKQAEVEQAKADTDQAQAVADQQYADMKQRLRYLYETEKGDGLLEVFFAARSFSDILNQAEYVESLSAYDSRKLAEYRQNVEYLKLCRQMLEEEEATLQATQEGLESEEASVNALIEEKGRQIQAYQSDINTKSAAAQEYEAQIAEQNAVIAALEKAVAEEKAKLAEQNRLKYDGGMFQMPCPGYKRISDDYGNRIHPILGTKQFHNGVDFAAANGTPILAAYDGKVVDAAKNSSMGNYVMIDHGDGLYTIYMHASKLYVSKGQTVSKGEQIAAVGATGRATGPHLHFSVRLNGSYVSPWNYLK